MLDWSFASFPGQKLRPHISETLLNSSLSESPLENTAHKYIYSYRGADKSLARPRRKQGTATEDFDIHVSYL